VTKIVPLAGAKQEPVPTVEGPPSGGRDQIVTQVIAVQDTAVAQLVPILRPLLPPEAHLAAYPATNVLIVSDSYGNVQRIADIVRRIDRASNDDVEVIPLRHAAASEVVRVLTNLEQGRQQADPASATNPVRLIADERSNSILLSGIADDRLRLRALIAHLDTPLQATGNTQVIYLRYAKANDLLAVLQGVSAKLEAEAEGAGQAPGEQGAAAAALVRDSRIDIQADEATNALIITANPAELQTLRSVIAQLDIRRAQVLVEAVIAEISSDKVAELGVQWLADGRDNGSILGFINFDSPSFNGLSLTDLAGALIDETLSGQTPVGAALGLGDFDGSVRFGALINALSSDADTNILSTPTLVTLDNEEAEIIVGQNVPFITGTFTTDVSGGGVGNPFQTIERRDVGVTLRVKPQINEGNAVQLEIIQEVSSVVQSATALAQGPTTNKRSIKTNVLLEDGQVLVLGGLIDDRLSETMQKVPGLGDIPLFGNLFRYRQTTKEKRNLMIFLHPVILRDAAAGTLRTNDKYSYIRQQQMDARQRGVALLPEVETPLLKPPDEVRRQGSLIGPGPATTPPAPKEPEKEPVPVNPWLGGYRAR
jgi:general secretion pathway protein D